jgi:hypothetical protein
MTRLVREADAQRDSRLLREFAASGLSVGCANTFLNPVGRYMCGLTQHQHPRKLVSEQRVGRSRTRNAAVVPAGQQQQNAKRMKTINIAPLSLSVDVVVSPGSCHEPACFSGWG